MKLVIDLQGTQTESRFRGIGRQTRALATAIIQHASKHDVHLLFNHALKGGLDETISYFKHLLPATQLHVFDIPVDVKESNNANLWRMRATELAREAYLADMRADIVYLSSLFEGVHDNAVTSIGLMHAPHLTAVTLFDLIPLYDEKRYLAAQFMRSFIYRRLQSLKRADLLLAISESARREAMELLGIPQHRIKIASPAADAAFRQVSLSDVERAVLRRRYKLPESFILYVGAIESRKNVSIIIQAFSKLPSELQKRTAVVIGGRIYEPERFQLLASAARFGVGLDRIIFIDYIDDEDLPAIYSICDLFVFPSMHEGFGLPPLEAMACGTPVLASRNSSLPEVMGRDDLMFETTDSSDLAVKMQRILEDQEYSRSLRQWVVDHATKFSWKVAGLSAIEALESLYEQKKSSGYSHTEFGRKPRLAFFSPLLPIKSGVADYSAELLRELGRFYDIECIIEQSDVSDPWVQANFTLRNVSFFERHANSYDRIVYSVGNSEFHVHMLRLLPKYPGVVILHDFFLSGVLNWLGNTGRRPPEDFLRHLYSTHGLPALVFAEKEGREAAATHYAANDIVFSNALGIIVHSQFVVLRAQEIYGPSIINKMMQVPHLRSVMPNRDRSAARHRLGIPHDEFVVCSFGIVAETKLSDRLFEAWIESWTGRSGKAALVYVGEHHGGPWSMAFERAIAQQAAIVSVEITGYVDSETYRDYLSAADLAIQLRKNSRGETSGAVLHCMAAGLPVIVNAHGTAAELSDRAVCKLPDQFSNEQLSAVIDELFDDGARREELGLRGRAEIAQRHQPAVIGEQIYDAIERFSTRSDGSNHARLLEGLRELYAPVFPREGDFEALSEAIARNRRRPGFRRILYDITLFAESDARTGIERVVRSILLQLIRKPPAGFHVEPIRIEGNKLRFARAALAQRVGIPADILPDSPVDADLGDIYVAAEWAADRLPQAVDWLLDFRRRGGRVVAFIYDLLPLQYPNYFPSYISPIAQHWFNTVLRVTDHLLCDSRCVAADVIRYGNALFTRKNDPIYVDYFRPSADLKLGIPTMGVPDNARYLLGVFRRRKTFLMVGTIEPRKGHLQTIQAFQCLWKQGVDVNLVIVGRKGWSVNDVERAIRNSPERNRRLFWLNNVSDEFLGSIYGHATALIAASRAEGFGLPLIEAAAHGVPLIVRDIPVFREVAETHAYYFVGSTAEALAQEIREWLGLYEAGNAPDSSKIETCSWEATVDHIFAAISTDRHFGVIGTED
jgi:glycosyltransferase involved in cell wall biosynthesis